MDGRDANPYASVAWFFGRIRYMSAGGLERKSKPREHVEKGIAS